jgi:hypothetical protein
MDFNPFDLHFNGVKISIESDAVVPDTTKDAGPDTIKLHEDAQKEGTEPSAEYDASEHVDVPEDVEKANESTFFGIILKRRSSEAFAKTKGVFPSADAFFKSNECKQAIAIAKQWIEKHGGGPASQGDLPDGAKKAGFTTKSIGGILLTYSVKKNKLYADVVYKNKSGKACTKSFASVKIGGASAESAPAAAAKPKKAAATAKPKAASKVDKVLLGKEDDDPVDTAFQPEAEPVEAPAPVPEPAVETPPAEPAEPVAPPVVEETDVTPEEIEAETGAESFIGAVSKILKSREEADAAVSDIEDSEIDEVVGDGEGDDVSTIPEPSTDVSTEPAAPPEPAEPEDEESKAIEAFLASADF